MDSGIIKIDALETHDVRNWQVAARDGNYRRRKLKDAEVSMMAVMTLVVLLRLKTVFGKIPISSLSCGIRIHSSNVTEAVRTVLIACRSISSLGCYKKCVIKFDLHFMKGRLSGRAKCLVLSNPTRTNRLLCSDV